MKRKAANPWASGEAHGAGGGRKVDPASRHPGKGSLRLLKLTPRGRRGFCQANGEGTLNREMMAHERPRKGKETR